MKLKSKNRQEFITAQVITLVFSFISFNVIVQDTDWLILSSVIFLIAMNIIVRIWQSKFSIQTEKASKSFRRVL